MKLWQTFSTMCADGVQVGVALYDGADSTFELVHPDKCRSIDEANAVLAILDIIAKTLNAVPK